jgi:hypothetical protein
VRLRSLPQQSNIMTVTERSFSRVGAQPRKPRRMSAAARKRIADAQRKRWGAAKKGVKRQG